MPGTNVAELAVVTKKTLRSTKSAEKYFAIFMMYFPGEPIRSLSPTLPYLCYTPLMETLPLDKTDIAEKIRSSTAHIALRLAAKLAVEADRLKFGGKAAFVYNPLRYAWEPHAAYIENYCTGPRKVLFLGMNPGPWGMAQTGVPFGEIAAVRDWLGIVGEVGKPDSPGHTSTSDSPNLSGGSTGEHPKKPIQGFSCPRSEVSGRRLWNLMKDRFGEAEHFFQDHFVTNYCPLIFLEEGGKNLTPDKLPAAEREKLFRVCDAHLRDLITLLEPDFVIGVGKFAEKRAAEVVKQISRAAVDRGEPGTFKSNTPTVASILHPSPASPAANRGWAEQATVQLEQLGVW